MNLVEVDIFEGEKNNDNLINVQPIHKIIDKYNLLKQPSATEAQPDDKSDLIALTNLIDEELTSLLKEDEIDNSSLNCNVDNKTKQQSESPKSSSTKRGQFDVLKSSKKTSEQLKKSETAKYKLSESLIHNGDTDSSDDEDNKCPAEQNYSESGREIKNILKKSSKPISGVYSEIPTWKSKPKQAVLDLPKRATPDLSGEPFFGIRVINPLISSKGLKERMEGKTTVNYDNLQKHVKANSKTCDWVLPGVIVSSFNKISQKGNPFICWTLSDLKGDLKTVSIFLFGQAYKGLKEVTPSQVVAILNPTPLDNNKSKNNNIGTLSVQKSDQVMILGKSQDLSVCKARKKSGEPCTSFVNKTSCEYCVYHVQQEYRKVKGRSELQSSRGGVPNLRNKVLGKNEVFYGGKSFTSVKAKVNKKQAVKDKTRLSQLYNVCQSRLGLIRLQAQTSRIGKFITASPTAQQQKGPVVTSSNKGCTNSKEREVDKGIDMKNSFVCSEERLKETIPKATSRFKERLKMKQELQEIIPSKIITKCSEKVPSNTAQDVTKENQDALVKLDSEKSILSSNEKMRLTNSAYADKNKVFKDKFHDKDTLNNSQKTTSLTKQYTKNRFDNLTKLKSTDTKENYPETSKKFRKCIIQPQVSESVDVSFDFDDNSRINRHSGTKKHPSKPFSNKSPDSTFADNVLTNKSVGKQSCSLRSKDELSSKNKLESFTKLKSGAESKTKDLVQNKHSRISSMMSQSSGADTTDVDASVDFTKSSGNKKTQFVMEDLSKPCSNNSNLSRNICEQKAIEKQTALLSRKVKQPTKNRFENLTKLKSNSSKTNICKTNESSIKMNMLPQLTNLMDRFDVSFEFSSEKETDSLRLTNKSLEEHTIKNVLNMSDGRSKSSHQLSLSTGLIEKKTSGIEEVVYSSNTPDLEKLSKSSWTGNYHRNSAKRKALNYVKCHGPIKKDDEKTKKCKAVIEKIEADAENKKRKQIDNEETEEDSKAKRSKRFIELMNQSSAHEELILNAENEALDEYYDKMEMKEKMEEKMLTTYKVECKAFKCLKCNYKALGPAPLCKAEKHPIKRITALKRFFECHDCKNRTFSLDIVPLKCCDKCGSSHWERTAMMKERKVPVASLSIRGGEQKFINATVQDANLDLLVPADS